MAVTTRIARCEEKIIALYRLFDEREKQVEIAFTASQDANKAALAAQQVVNATQNEFRGALADRERLSMPRSEAEALFKAIDEKDEQAHKSMMDKIDALEVRANAREEQGKGLHQGWLIFASAVGIIATIVSLFALFNK